MIKLKYSEPDKWKEIPEGFRYLEDWECIREQWTNSELRKYLDDCLIVVNTPDGLVSVGLYCTPEGYHLDTYPTTYSNLRGVFVKKHKGDCEMKEKKYLVTKKTTIPFSCEITAQNWREAKQKSEQSNIDWKNEGITKTGKSRIKLIK